jgi:SAM-dependent methyltransferase
LLKNENGFKTIVDIFYGDTCKYQISIEAPNKVTVGVYNGVRSVNDPETHFGFDDKSILDLCKFFNSFNFGYDLKPKDLVSIDKYPDSYKRKARLYIIKNRDFSILPQNQFGFILCWDNFDYLTYDIIQKYLQEAFRLLRPGGIFMFSYTNCDLELSALKVDHQIAAYCSSGWLLKSLEEIGYEVINLVDCNGPTYDPNLGLQEYPISWAEVRKPGKLTTVKRAQAQGLVLKK